MAHPTQNLLTPLVSGKVSEERLILPFSMSLAGFPVLLNVSPTDLIFSFLNSKFLFREWCQLTESILKLRGIAHHAHFYLWHKLTHHLHGKRCQATLSQSERLCFGKAPVMKMCQIETNWNQIQIGLDVVNGIDSLASQICQKSVRASNFSLWSLS